MIKLMKDFRHITASIAGLLFLLFGPPGGLKAQETGPQVQIEVETAPSLIPETSAEGRALDVEPVDIEKPIEIPDGVKLGLRDCVQMALLNNRQIKASNYDVEAAEYKLKEAQPRSVPTIDYEFLTAPAPRDVDDAVESFFSGNVTFLQRGSIKVGTPLYTFGKIGLAQDLATEGIKAEKQKRTEKKNDIVLEVKKLYWGILLAKDLRDLFLDAAGHLESEIDRRESSEEPSDPIELVKLKLYRYEVLSRLSQVEKKDYLARQALRVQLGLPRATQVQVADQHLEPVDYELKDFQHYLNLSQKFRPKNILAEIGLKAKELEYRLEKRKILPDIGIGGFFEFGVTAQSIQGLQLTDDFNDPFNFTRAGVGLRVQGKLNAKTYSAKVKQKQAEYFKVAMQKSAAEDGLELEIREAYLDVQHQKKNLKNSDDAKKTARQFVFLTKTNVDIGIGSKEEYSEALQAYLLSQGRYLEAVLKYNMAVATLEDKVGGLATLVPYPSEDLP